MELTVKGMMCAHCEAHVKEALEKIDGVTNVIADHEKNLVTLSAATAIDESILKAAVEGAGYEFAGIRQIPALIKSLFYPECFGTESVYYQI